MPTDDPEGTETRSEHEYRQRLDILTREALGQPQKEQKNPEGVPESDRGHGRRRR